jgi:hypothetical protein
MSNLFGSLVLGIWDFQEIWCLEIEIYEVLNTRDVISKDCPYFEYSIVKFHIRGQVHRLQPMDTA